MNRGHQTFAILFWLNNQRSKNEKSPIYLRLTIDCKRVEIATHQMVFARMWDQKAQRVKCRLEEAQIINRQLDIMQSDIHKHYGLLLAREMPVSAEIIKKSYLRIGEKQRSFLEIFDLHNHRLSEKVAAGKKSANTLKRFVITKHKLISFLKYQLKVTDIQANNIKLSFGIEFEHYLSTVQKIGTNTSMKYVQNVKQVLKMGVDLGLILSNPLAAFKCSYQHPDRDKLTMDEITILRNKDLVARLDTTRDVFLFCCFTGYAYLDVYNLTPQNIITGIDGNKWIIKAREKTKSLEQIPLLPVALGIVEKYKDHPACINRNTLLPVNSNQRYNGYLKEIADICGIKKHLTTHTARHTFATTVTLEHDVPIETVSQMLGHKSLRTTQIYAKVTQRKVSNNMEELKKRLIDREASDVMQASC